MSDIFDLYKAYAIGGPLGAAAQKGKLKVDYDDSGFERGLKVAGQTWLDFNSRLTKGLSKSIEGIVDLGLGIGAGVAGLFGADEAQRNLEKRIRYNWTEENFKSFDDQNIKSGLRGNKVGEFVGNVTEGIGGMVPAIATGGAGVAVMAAGAAGNATEEALNEGASLGSALAYGGITGGIEAVTEKIGGFTFGGGKSLLGKVTAGTGLGKFLSKGAGKVVGDFVSEGAEEVLADTLNPLVKKGTGVDKRSLKDQYSEVVPGLGETFLVGGTVGSVMSGGQSFMRNNANKSRGGARATRADDYLGYISEVSSNLNGENTDSRYERAINDSFLEVERELIQMSESARKNYLKSIEKTPFKLAFDEGGKYIGAKAESVNSQAITNNLRSVSANLKYKAIKADTEVSEDATRAKELIEDVLKDDGASVVITDELSNDNRATYDTGIVYINNNMVFDDAFTNEAVAIHELAHYSEGTSEYNALIDAIHEAGKIDEIQTYLESKKYSSTEYEGATDKQQDYIERTELAADIVGHLLSTPSALAKLHARNKNVFAKLKAAIEASGDDTTSKEAKKAINKVLKNFEKAVDASQGGVLLSSIRDDEEKKQEAQAVRNSGKVSDARFSLQFADDIAKNQRHFVINNDVYLTQRELEFAIEQTAHMVEIMSSHKDILPEDKIGKTLVKNGSYDLSVENTTICVRTLAYNSFIDMVSDKIGRPLTQMESFLVSQKLYDIAKEPQCLYCYVSLDRKAYNDMILRYIDQRDAALDAYESAGRPDVTRDSQLYMRFLAGRKDTKDTWRRYNSWINAYKNGERLLSPADVATEKKRSALSHGTMSQVAQIKDMLKYAQSATWAKKQTQYVAYYDDILRISDKVVKDLNKHYGLRWYSFSDYSGAFIVENMQQITDASIRGLKGLAYTKDTDFVKIFAPTGMNINISVYAKRIGDHYEIDASQSANIDEAIKLRKIYPNVGIVVVATDVAGVEWALSQEWSDVVIPFHTVRTGAQVAEYYNWEVFNKEQNDSVEDQNMWDAYVNSLTNGKGETARKKISKMVYPSEHQNNRETYLRLIEERGLKPRFSSFLDNPNYMKLVNETRQSEAETVALKPVFDVDAAEAAFQKFVDKGGYYEGWYNDGIDVESEAETVAQDVLAGKKANEVSYGRQDIDTDSLLKGRKINRKHGVGNERNSKVSEENGIGWNDLTTHEKEMIEQAENVTKKRLSELTSHEKEIRRQIEDLVNKPFSQLTPREKELKWQIENVIKIEEDSKRLNGNVGWEDLKKSLPETDDAGYYDDLQIHAKPRKKADKQEQKNVEPPKDEPKEKAEKPKRPLRVTAALTKQEGENVIAYIIDKHFKHFTEDTKTAFIPGEMKKQIINDLVNIAGTTEDAVYVGKVYDLAEKICNEIKVKEEYDYSDKADVQQATRTKQAIEEYRNKLNLDVIHDDIKSIFDTRTASLMKKWKDFKHRGISLDMAAQALREEGVRIDATNEADIFVKMVTQYDQAEEIVKKAHEKATLSVKDLLINAAEKTALVEELADDLHTISKKNVSGEYFKASIKILHICQQFGDLKKGRYANATENQDNALAEIYNHIKGIRGGAISITNLIKTFKFLKVWYSKENKSIENHIDSEVASIIDEMSARDVSPLNTVELKNILKVLQRVKSLLENYTKIYRDGKNVEIKDVVDNDLKVIKAAETNNTSLVKFYKKGFFRNFGDPQFVCEIIDGYKKGFASELLNDFREGAIKYEKAKIDLLKEWDDFAKKNKTYLKELFKRTVKVNGVEVPMDVALSVLMTHKRAHAQQGLTFNGFDYEDKNGTSVKVEGVDRAAISTMSAQFTEKDKEFISVVENVFKKCKGFKEQTDMIRLGFTNTVSGYYYPIFRVHAKNIDSNDLFYQTDSVNSVHFNKNTVQGAKQRLIVKSAVKTLIDHVEGISRYYGYSIPIDNFNRVYNYNTVENRNDPVTVGTELNRGWGEGAKYLVKLAADAQGKRMEQGPGDKVIAALRSGYVKFQLGANPKVLVTQLSSYLAAFDKLSSKALVKGFGINGKDVDKYCTLAEIRNYSQQAVKAVSVKDELNNTTDKLMAPIGMVDRMVVCRLFGACQVEVNAKYGLEIGSKENKVKAGEMLKDLIFETQQNSFATERSAMMRGNSEFWRAMTMFSADSMKLWGRWLGSLGKYFTIRREIYLTRENMLINEDVRMKNIKILEGELADCKMVVGKTTATVMSVAAFMALIACAFRHLYRKDDEEENDIKTGAFDFIGNLVGMFPVARDVYSYFVDGFEISSFAIDSLNGVMSSLKKTIDLSYSIVKGDNISTQNIVKTIKDTVNATGQIIGLPTRNIYNVATGLTRRFSENAGYHVDSVFYEKSYSADLRKAIENGNDSLALTIVSMASAGDERYSGEAAQVISNLYGEGYNCLPRTISEKLTVAGVEYELTGKQYRSINQEYGKANTVINDMVGSASFRSLSAESQSKAIKFANDYYFALATEKGLGISYNSDSSYYKKLVYGKLIDVNVLALAVAKVNEIKSTAAEGENVRQKVRDYIESLALTAEQKYLLFNYFGYTSGVDKERMISYIKSNSKLTAENKEYLLKRYN